MPTSPYDALLLVSFGGPEGPDEVVPFLKNVTHGRGIPAERLEEVGAHYFARGGVSPINAENRALLAALEAELARRGHDLPVVWGNRNWTPYTGEALTQLARAGHRRILAVTTSAYPSYSSCRQYREDLGEALETLQVEAPEVAAGLTVDRIRQYAQTPGFVDANVDAVVEAYAAVPDDAALVFVTHSIPLTMAQTAGPEPRSARGSYVDWHETVAQRVAAGVGERLGRDLPWTLAYCSRSGPPTQPWLEPDINDHLEQLHRAGVTAVVLSPIGFTSDHMEVVHDLDTEAAATARELGLGFARAATARTHPSFVAGLVDLVEERAAAARGEQSLPRVVDGGSPGLYACPATCCPAPRPTGRRTAGDQAVVPAAEPGQGRARSGRVITSET